MGLIAVLLAVTDRLAEAALFILIGIFFDFFDGLVARWLKVQSEFGIQLDSLADVVTSGVAPGMIMFQLFMRSLRRDWMDGLSCEVGNWITFEEKTGIFSSWEINKVQYLPFIGLLLSLAAAYRLARFNIDKRQTNYFIGLPTPAMSLFVLSLPLILLFNPGGAIESLILNKYFLIAVTGILSILMNVELKMFSLKLKSSTLRDNWAQLTFVLVAILLIFLFKIVALPLIILFYILFSFFLQLGSKKV